MTPDQIKAKLKELRGNRSYNRISDDILVRNIILEEENAKLKSEISRAIVFTESLEDLKDRLMKLI